MKQQLPFNSKSQKQKQKTLNPKTIKKVYYTQYTSNPLYSQWSSDKIEALYNRYGFLGIWPSGFKSTGTNTWQVQFPTSFDLSLQQENGFTLFFWLVLNKQPNNLIRNILKKGNSIDNITPTIGILPNNTNLFVKLTTSHNKTETIISNKKIENNKLYSISITITFDTEDELTEISLYIDGYLDSQISVPGWPLHNNGDVNWGKPDSTTHGFVGIISEIMLSPKPLSEEDIFDINNECVECWQSSNGESFNTAIIFEEKFERLVLTNKYLKYTGALPEVWNNLKLSNCELKEVVKKYDEEERVNENEIKANYSDDPDSPENIYKQNILQKVQNFFNENEENFFCIKKIYFNSKIINTVLYLANKGDEIIEMKRIIDIFEVLSANLLFNFDLNFLIKIAKIVDCIVDTEKKFININKFFEMITLIHDEYFPEDVMNGFYEYEDEKEKENNAMQQHEYLLKQSQNFKDTIEEETHPNEEYIYKTGIVIKALYDKKLQEELEEKNKITKQVEKDSIDKDIVNQGENLEENKEDEKSNANIIKNSSEEDVFMTGTKFQQQPKQNDINIEKEKENKNPNKPLDKEEINNNDKEMKQVHDYDPDYPPNWNEGAFKVVINHCYNCNQHKTTTRHIEQTFINKYNEIAKSIIAIFPNAIVNGNYDEWEYFGEFDVYLHGIGPFFDNKERYYIYKKSKNLKFPTSNEICDKWVALSIVYGSSLNMESAQAQFVKENQISKPCKYYHS